MKQQYFGFAGVDDPLIDLGEHENLDSADEVARNFDKQGQLIVWIATKDQWEWFLKKNNHLTN